MRCRRPLKSCRELCACDTDKFVTFFDYFQIASVAVVVVIIVGKASYLLFVKGINPIVIGGGKKGFSRALELIAVVGLLVWIVEVLLSAFHASLRIFPSPLNSRLLNFFPAKCTGVALITLGLLLLTVSYVSFGDSWRVGFDVRRPGVLVTTGIFALSRNPIYVFLDLWFVGIFLINGTLIFLIMALLAIAFLHWQILQEEEFLLQLYGQPYRSYCVQTGRYIIR